MKKILVTITIVLIGIIIIASGCSSQTSAAVNDYNERLNEYITFWDEWQNLSSKYEDMANSPMDNFSNAETYDDQIYYARMLIDIYQECYNESLILNVPDCAEEEHSHWLEIVSQSIIAETCVVNDDIEGAVAAYDKIDSATNLCNEAAIKTMEDFNKEAESLGLSKPFDTSQMQ